LAAVLVLIALNKFNVRNFIPYLLVGILLWEFTHQSGIHATISGVLLALLIPHDKIDKKKSLLLKLEHAIAPYVAFGIMPLFAFANAGVSLEGINLRSLLNPVPLGILCGLFFGKQIGVFFFAYMSVKLNFAQKPNNYNWMSLYAVSVLTGIGFTMSLFVGNLAFANSPMYLDGVKIGVLSGSLLSTLVGYFLLIFSIKK
jgi:NhaA family Na+:H+ antiporter